MSQGVGDLVPGRWVAASDAIQSGECGVDREEVGCAEGIKEGWDLRGPTASAEGNRGVKADRCVGVLQEGNEGFWREGARGLAGLTQELAEQGCRSGCEDRGGIGR